MKIEELNRLAEYRRVFSKPKLERENGFKTLKGDKNQISEKSQSSAEEHTHIITNKITNKKVICGFFAVEEKSHESRETDKKDEHQMRKVEKIEDDDEFSV